MPSSVPSSRPISIHALHEESDRIQLRFRQVGTISIHALHEESDRCARPARTWTTYFNPRSP